MYNSGVACRIYDTLSDYEADDGMALDIIYCYDLRLAVLRNICELAVRNNGNERTVYNAPGGICSGSRPAAEVSQHDC